MYFTRCYNVQKIRLVYWNNRLSYIHQTSHFWVFCVFLMTFCSVVVTLLRHEIRSRLRPIFGELLWACLKFFLVPKGTVKNSWSFKYKLTLFIYKRILNTRTVARKDLFVSIKNLNISLFCVVTSSSSSSTYENIWDQKLLSSHEIN